MGGDIPPLGPKAWDGLTKMMAENQAEAFGTSFEEEYEMLVKAGVARKRRWRRKRAQ